MLFKLPETYRVSILAALRLQYLQGQCEIQLVDMLFLLSLLPFLRLSLGEDETEQRTLGRRKIYPQLGTGSHTLF